MNHKSKPHSETAFMPMITRDGRSDFFVLGEHRQKAACRARFCAEVHTDWPVLLKEGWRIVKVHVSVMTEGQIKAAKGTRR